MTTLHNIKLKSIQQKERRKYFEDLLLADESKAAVSTYINDGEMFSIWHEKELVGVVLFLFHPKKTIELKNIALRPAWRGKGMGKAVITRACEHYKREGFCKMRVGTANSSIGNLAFYQKAGFRMVEIRKDFFRHYPTPIFEDGIRAMDMVVFERKLV